MAVYQAGLRLGYYRKSTQEPHFPKSFFELDPAWIKKIQSSAEKVKSAGIVPPIEEANEICKGQYRLFGGDAIALNLDPGMNLPHWTQYELGKAKPPVEDVKFTWEPARLGWAIVLARAYALSLDSRYTQSFWEHIEKFLVSNPPYMGPNWTSAQESAFRIIALSFALPLFWDAPESTPDRKQRIINSLAVHTQRITSTLAYARAQNNNHLLMEGTGLFTAGVLLQTHPESSKWKSSGWKIINHCLQTQIDPGGEYCQHSVNYHRLMLQASLWVDFLSRYSGTAIPEKSLNNLQQTVSWLLALVDPKTGEAPNLGHNDGSLLLPLTTTSQSNYLPTLSVAERAFGGASHLNPDEMTLWLDLGTTSSNTILTKSASSIHSISKGTGRAYLRSYCYKNRPAHADQLHIDLWKDSKPVTLDPGSFQYNALAPWDNGLAGTLVHNTVTIDGQDQMTRFSRFLWLDWARTGIIEETEDKISAGHLGYEKLGCIHRRTVEAVSENHWIVTDQIIFQKRHKTERQVILNWNFSDGQWDFDNDDLILCLQDLASTIQIIPLSVDRKLASYQLIRAGEKLFGEGEIHPLLGWFSPTYGSKIPCLSFRMLATTSSTISFKTVFQFK